MEFSNWELWQMAEDGVIERNEVFEDREGNQIIFTGKSFQTYYTDASKEEKYVGMCLGDSWKSVGIGDLD
jgi:hypothetical protein